MKSNNSRLIYRNIKCNYGGFVDSSFVEGNGRNITVVPNSLDFSDILKFGTLGAGIVWRISPNSRGDFADIFKSGPSCVSGALGPSAVKLNTLL